MQGEKRTASVWLICMVLKTRTVEEKKLGSIPDFTDFFFSFLSYWFRVWLNQLVWFSFLNSLDIREKKRTKF